MTRHHLSVFAFNNQFKIKQFHFYHSTFHIPWFIYLHTTILILDFGFGYSKTVKRENIYFISFLISIYHYLHQIGFLPVSLPSSWVENGIKCGVCPLWQNLALCLAAMKIKRRYSSLLYFNEKITVQNAVIETHREHAITITFCIQTCFRTKYYPPSPKKKIVIFIYWQFWHV